jgi:hypothetical protein
MFREAQQHQLTKDQYTNNRSYKKLVHWHYPCQFL